MTHNDNNCKTTTLPDLIEYLLGDSEQARAEREAAERQQTIDSQDYILSEVRRELDRQLDKWGVQNRSLVEWVSIEAEEFGEAAMDANKAYFGALNLAQSPDATSLAELEQKVAEADKIEARMQALRQEWIQVAAVAVAAVENLDRSAASVQPLNAMLDVVLEVLREHSA